MKQLYECGSDIFNGWNIYYLPNIFQENHQDEPIAGITTSMIYASGIFLAKNEMQVINLSCYKPVALYNTKNHNYAQLSDRI